MTRHFITQCLAPRHATPRHATPCLLFFQIRIGKGTRADQLNTVMGMHYYSTVQRSHLPWSHFSSLSDCPLLNYGSLQYHPIEILHGRRHHTCFFIASLRLSIWLKQQELSYFYLLLLQHKIVHHVPYRTVPCIIVRQPSSPSLSLSSTFSAMLQCCSAIIIIITR